MPEPLSPDFAPLAAAVRGRYELVRELGRGGMGLVCLAHDLSLDRFVAIKTLPAALAADATWRARFLREARAAAQLSHPHIVPIHAVEEHPDVVCFVMAYVAGESLGARIRRTGPLGVREGVRLLREVAWALGHAHARGVTHRDIKPDNVLLDAESGRAMVTDFGLAARARVAEASAGPDAKAGVAADPSSTSVPASAPASAPAGGTVHFMSPEQAAGEPGGPSSDLYAWGATAWVVATGRPPFDGRSKAAVLAAQLASPAPPFAAAAPEWPALVASAVDRALARQPAERWADADALAAALGGVLPVARVAPAPVRAFLREVDRVGSELAMLGTVTVVSKGLGSVLLYGAFGFDVPWFALFTNFIAIVAGLATAARAAGLTVAAREMLRRGFGHAALQLAAANGAGEPDDERALARDAARRDRRPLVRQVSLGILGTAITLAVATGDFEGDRFIGVLEIASAAVSIILSTFVVRALWRLAVPEGGLVSRLLRGRLGAAFFRVAGVGLPRHVQPAAPDAALSELLALAPASDGPRLTELIERAREQGLRARAYVDPPISEPSAG